MRSPHHALRGGLAAVLVIVVLAGCTHENDERSQQTSPRTSSSVGSTSSVVAPTDSHGDDPGTAYAAWHDALARQDAAAACERQAPEFTIDLRYAAILQGRAHLGDACTVFEALVWEEPGFESRLVGIAVTQQTDEDALLAVTLGLGEEIEAQTVRMVYHRARWRVFSTTDRTVDEDADDDVDEGTADTPADDTSGPDRWVRAWCDLDPSMSAEEIIRSMGAPSGEYTVSDGGDPQLWWAQDQYDFRVYLDVDRSVLDLVGDYDALSDADRSVLGCPELR